MKLSILPFFPLLLLLASLLLLACTSNADTPTVSPGVSIVQDDVDAPLSLAISKESLSSSVVSSGASGFPTLNSEGKGIGVTGSASIFVAPDLAVLDIGAESIASTVGLARAAAAKAMESVILSLNGEGISDQDIQTRRFDIYPRYEYQEAIVGGRPTSKQVLSGYVWIYH